MIFDDRRIKADLTELFHSILHDWTQRGEGAVEKYGQRVGQDFSGFGTGRQERYTDHSVLMTFLRQEIREAPNAFEVQVLWTNATVLTPSVGIVEAEAEVSVPVDDAESVTFLIRWTFVFQLTEGEWLVVHSHGSIPASDQPEGETLPIDGLRARNKELERLVSKRTDEVTASLVELKRTQGQLIHAEKMASMGLLTAGIAHEIKNPLNFVNNFAQLSVELADDLVEKLKVSEGRPPDDMQDLLADLKQNAEKIEEHGKRADDIVRSMLAHTRGGAGERRAADVNELVEEYADLAYHSMRASAPGFNVTIEHDFDESVGKIVMAPREIGRVLLNLFTNAFYAVHEKALSDDSFSPTVLVRTLRDGTQVEIHVSDNGPGIDEALREKIFEPFFTTKPTGSGAGLGLSLSYDIVTQGHGGTLIVESEEGQGATFIITLPASSHAVNQSA